MRTGYESRTKKRLSDEKNFDNDKRQRKPWTS
jgi:hypothetical protein